MNKTQRILAAVVLAAGASAMTVTGANAAGHASGQPGTGSGQSAADRTAAEATSLSQLNKLKELNQLNQLMEVPNRLAPLTDPVTQVAGAIQ
ncbi:hypothetical protein ACIBCM_32895 [Streptomyces sp. NPDC051018]|uniref:hypothetical protein n=1 Tax=Streptomyces sp. NPDC051018 TaxID=3365639 RepID=UPI00378F69C8